MKFKTLQSLMQVVIGAVLMFSSVALYAQPANDLCSGAINIVPAANPASIVWTPGTTVGTLDGLTQPGPTVCSANFYRDDVWYKMTIPVGSPGEVLNVKIKNITIPATGLAIYTSNACDPSNAPYLCNNFAVGAEGIYTFSEACSGGEGNELLIRVWSGDGPAASWETGKGTFEIAAYYDKPASEFCLWGNNEEGSFNGGFNDWVAESNSCAGFPLWTWSNTDYCTQGAFSAGGGTITSLSNCDGAACFDSDYYDNGGDPAGGGTGPCPATQSGTLTSPTIDLSGFPAVSGVNVVFNQALRHFQSEYYVEYSIDGGANYASIQINTVEEDPDAYATNGPHVNNVRRVFLPGAAGQSNVKVRFRYEANYYYWIIDDVKICEREAYNVAVTPFYAIAPNYNWPIKHNEAFNALIDVENRGSKNATNVVVTLDITDPSGANVYSQELDYSTIAADSTVENKLWASQIFIDNPVVGQYNATYTVTADSTDFDPTDNTRTFSWNYLEDDNAGFFSKDNLDAPAGGVRPSDDINFTWGNIYHNLVKAGDLIDVNEIGVGVSNAVALAGIAGITVYLDEWSNEDGDNVADETERTRIGFSSYDFVVGDLDNTLFSLPILDFNTLESGVQLKANTTYIASVEYNAPSTQPDLGVFISSSANIDYSAQTFASTLLGNGPERYAHILSVGNGVDWTCNTFTGGTVPMVRLQRNKIVSTTEVELNANNKIIVAPNPVKERLNVNFDLEKEVKYASIQVMDIHGKVYMTRELRNVKANIESFDVSRLASGTYFVYFQTEEGIRTVRFNVSQ